MRNVHLCVCLFFSPFFILLLVNLFGGHLAFVYLLACWCIAHNKKITCWSLATIADTFDVDIFQQQQPPHLLCSHLLSAVHCPPLPSPLPQLKITSTQHCTQAGANVQQSKVRMVGRMEENQPAGTAWSTISLPIGRKNASSTSIFICLSAAPNPESEVK